LLKKPSLLIVTSSPELCDALNYHLEDFFSVSVCSDGPSALAYLCRYQPDFAFIDLFLAGMDGVSLLAAARSRHVATRVFTMSTLYTDAIRRTLAALEAEYAVFKPFNVSVIAETIKRLAKTDPKLELLRADIRESLLELGVYPHYEGFLSLCTALEVMLIEPENTPLKAIYIQTASRMHLGLDAIERNIRTVIHAAWEHRDIHIWNRFFGSASDSDTQRPSNAAFMLRLAEHLRKE